MGTGMRDTQPPTVTCASPAPVFELTQFPAYVSASVSDATSEPVSMTVQALAAGQTVTDIFSYTNSDNHGGSSGASLTVTVTGSNDAPVISGPAIGSEGAPDWKAWVTTTQGTFFGQEFYRWMVYGDPNWTIASFDLAVGPPRRFLVGLQFGDGRLIGFGTIKIRVRPEKSTAGALFTAMKSSSCSSRRRSSVCVKS